jgi:hypothetical protein
MPLSFNKKTGRADPDKCLAMMGLARVMVRMMFLILLKETPVQAGQSVT